MPEITKEELLSSVSEEIKADLTELAERSRIDVAQINAAFHYYFCLLEQVKDFSERCKQALEFTSSQLESKMKEQEEENENSEAVRIEVKISDVETKKLKEATVVQDMLIKVAEIYHQNLTPELREYINKKWGISNETIDSMKIGYAKQLTPENPTLPNGTSLSHLVGTELDFEILQKTGLLIQMGDSFTEFFVGRIIFPCWNNGKVVNFAASGDQELLGTPKTKYETSKYKKLLTHSDKHPYVSECVNNRFIFGEDSIREQKYCIITEGIADSLVLMQNGYPALSPITPQFSSHDIDKLADLAKGLETIYICDDNETSDAGEKDAIKIATKLTQIGVNVKVIKLPKGEERKIDVAEYFLKHTKEEFDDIITKCDSIAVHLLRKYRPSKKEIDNIEFAKAFADDFVKYLPKDIAGQIIDFEVKEYFGLKTRDMKYIHAYYKRVKDETVEGNDILSFNKPDDAAFAVKVLSEEFVKNFKPVIGVGDALYVYEDGVYVTNDIMKSNARVYIQDTAWNFHHVAVSKSNADRVLKQVCDLRAVSASKLNSSKERICVKNGILDVITGILYPHTPEEYHTVKLDVTYDPNVTIRGTVFDQYINSTFKSVEWEIPIIQEMFGYCLLKDYFLEKFFFLIGDGENGKSVLINLLTKLLGSRNVSSMTLHEICKPSDQFSLINLHGRLANLCGETGTQEITDIGNIKRITGRDQIRSRELYCGWVEFYNYAKMIFSMNKPPVIEDATNGKKRRQMLLEFPNTFKEGVNAISNLEEQLMSPASLSGILNWALEGLSRLIKNGKFSDERTRAQMEIIYERKSNPIRYFVQDCINEADEGSYSTHKEYDYDIYQAYTMYAKKYQLPSLKQVEIREQLIEECRRVNITVKYRQDKYSKDKSVKRGRYFTGIVLCGEDIPEPDAEAKEAKSYEVPKVAVGTHNFFTEKPRLAW